MFYVNTLTINTIWLSIVVVAFLFLMLVILIQARKIEKLRQTNRDLRKHIRYIINMKEVV